jgi:ABC-type phosphate transport system substrate-binding protein
MASREITANDKAELGDKFQETIIGYDQIAIVVVDKP